MMNLENQIRESLKEKSYDFVPPNELKVKVMSSFSTKGTRLKKHLVSGVLIAALLIPTSAFAYQSIKVDEIYGSFETVKKHIASATMEGYLLFDAKLSQAQGDLDKDEYLEFKKLVKIVTGAKLEYGDQYGNIDYDKVPEEKLEDIRNTLFEIQPYFDMLNGQKSSKELLSAGEYEEYINALMIYEKILAQNEINTSDGPVEIEKIADDLQEEFLNARTIIRSVGNE